MKKKAEPQEALGPRFFQTQSEFRAWLAVNHATTKELVVGFHKVDSGRGGLTYPQALDEALCFGWIDAVRRGLDEHSYTIRFTPRKARSIWSQVNIRKMQEMIRQGLARPAGTKAFEERDPALTRLYSFEQTDHSLPPELEALFRADEQAWECFHEHPPGYRRTATWWVKSAKQAGTRLKRLEKLMDDSREGRRLAHLSKPGAAKPKSKPKPAKS